MGNSVSTTNVNVNVGSTNQKTVYDTPTTVNLLKSLFENENYGFSSFSSKDQKKIIQKTIENSQKQDQIKEQKFSDEPSLNEFINHLYTVFNNTSTNDGMVKYQIYSVQSLNSTITDNQYKSIWLPTSMTIAEAHRILSTILYSINHETIPVDLADYVLVYENIMFSLENQNKQLYEEILKISFRLNRIGLPPFKLLIIHKSQLLLLERKESKPLLQDNEPISILQLIMFHLITNNTHQAENQSEHSPTASNTSKKDQNQKYWPIIEAKMGIIPSAHLIHPLKHNQLRQIITKLSKQTKISLDTCIDILKKIFLSFNDEISYNKLMLPSLSKLIQVYDYPLLVALPYDRLILSQFYKIQCSDGRYAQGILANGKYYSLNKNSYIPMSELKINRGSIIHLRFNVQTDTIINGNLSSSETNQLKMSECCQEISNLDKNKFDSIKYQYSVEFDNNTVRLMFPSQVIDTILSTQKLDLQATTTVPKNTIINYFKSSNNWINPSTKINELNQQIDTLTIEKTDSTSSSNQISTANRDLIQTTLSSATLINKPSTSSLPLIVKPECLNCLSDLNDDNLECPHCTQVFCRICIESNYNHPNSDQCCPKCYNHVELSSYRKSTIINKFEKEGISALNCFNCHSIPQNHKLCSNSTCSTLFCDNCCKKSNQQESNSTGVIRCPRCKDEHMYISCAVMYYSRRIIEYQIAQEIESTSSITKPLPNTEWKEEDWLPERGTLEENHNRIISVIQFNGKHILFNNKKENNCPLLIINEPSEYTCPESLRLSYWNTDNDINRWEDDNNVQFHKYNQGSIGAYIPHFSEITARNTRFTEHIILDITFFHETYDYDFTTINDTGKTFQRGLESYTRPCGWYRKAIKVLDVYENAAWLSTGTDAWPVAYHGTSTANALSILRNGLFAGGSRNIPIANGAVHGRGIYLSPDPLYSGHVYYSKPLNINDRQYQVMFQVRVKQDSITKHDKNIWKCRNSQDVRPYGILFKET